MNKRFKGLTDKMRPRFQELSGKEPIAKDEIGKDPEKVPQQGVYVFYENDIPIYVGRSNNLKKRIRQHSGSNPRSAALAFNLVKDQHDSSKYKDRKALENTPDFKEWFKSARDCVDQMKIRVIEIKDQNEQALFEIYAATRLETKYNDFSTH